MIVSLFALIGFIFIFFFAQSLQMILVAEILAGIPWGSKSGDSVIWPKLIPLSLPDVVYFLCIRGSASSPTWLPQYLGESFLALSLLSSQLIPDTRSMHAGVSVN